MKNIIIVIFGLIGYLIFCPKFVLAGQSPETFEGKVTRIGENLVDVQIDRSGQKEIISALIGEGLFADQIDLKKGDLVLVSSFDNGDGQSGYYLADIVRRQSLLPLFVFFLVLVILVGGWRGIGSLLGLAVSLLIVIFFLVPQIATGKNPVLMVILSSLLIVPLTFYLSHGINRKTTIAISGTVISLIFAGLLAQGALQATRLTGLVSEEAGFLQSASPETYNLQGLLLAGIIIGLLGVLDDVTVSQAAIVGQLRSINTSINDKELFLRAMAVGKDHVSSMVNTLILVYVGASLPLLLLFYNNPQPFLQVINYEIFTEEIVRALIGSIGLILAIPLTTVLAVRWSR